VPLVDDGKAIGEVNLPNMHVQKIINNFSLLTAVVFPNSAEDEQQSNWNECVEYY